MSVTDHQVSLPPSHTGEDISERLTALSETQKATFNILEDFAEEKAKMQRLQQATVNLLEDADEDHKRFQKVQRALMNIVEDIEAERAKVEDGKALLELANKELEAFSYSVSHDLQAPLRAISGFSQVVLEDYGPKLDAQGERYLKLIQKNAADMGELITSLLSFARLARTAMTKSNVNMKALARTVFNELKDQMPDRNIKFKVGPLPQAEGDPAMLRQVFANLLTNALKFTRHRQTAVIEVGFKADADKGAYYVKDNGAGFDMQYVDKLFGVFQRLHRMEEFEGTGIGLAIVARVISRHGGRVWAEGAVDQGATFFFTLGRIIM